MPLEHAVNIISDQIVVTEKTGYARNIRAAVGARDGIILAAEGHLLDLLEPEQVEPSWKRRTPVLPAGCGNRHILHEHTVLTS